MTVSGAAIYPGSFDPVTYGHLDIIGRAAGLFPRFVVAVVGNPSKRPLFSADERVALLRAEVAALPDGSSGGIEVVAFDGLLVDLCASRGITTIVKGLRGAGDLDEAHGFEGALVFDKLDAGLQFEGGHAKRAGAPPGLVDERSGMALAALGGGDGELAEIEGICLGGQDDAGEGWRPDHPDFAVGEILFRQAMHR